MTPPDRYALVGHPVAHSRSPDIHARFAAQTGQHIEYGRLLAPLDDFAGTVRAFLADGGRGLNVTVPFKLEAAVLADRLTARAQAAGAVNTLRLEADGTLLGDNTDGAGLVADLRRLDAPLAGARVLLLGAGGAARGVLQPLLEAGVAALHVANRSPDRARELVAGRPATAGGFHDLPVEPFHLVVNATAAGLQDAVPPVPPALLSNAALAYDMLYGARPTAFMRAATDAGCTRVADGLGMLVEQAAQSFLLWRGVAPDTAPVHRALRAALSS